MEQRNQVRGLSFEQLSSQIIHVNDSTKQYAAKAINQAATLRNWLIGAYVVEYEQNGNNRAQYGDHLIDNLAMRLKEQNMNKTLLKNSRLFYLTYPNVNDCIQKSPTLSGFSKKQLTISPTVSDQFNTPAEVFVSHLSFSHIVELLTISDPVVRYFYESECIRSTWSVRELRRQIASNLHIRVGLSKDKLQALQLVNQTAEKDSFALQVRQPYTFEFLGLAAKDVVGESDLENALIDHLQDFMLELGKGFCFEARQKRMIIDDEYYFADLVFYNRLLHCNVIIELKNDEFRHEYIGQLNTYVSYYAENEMTLGDNPPIGILLCTRKGKKMVEYALGNLDQQLFVSTYQLQLPNTQELEAFILREKAE